MGDNMGDVNKVGYVFLESGNVKFVFDRDFFKNVVSGSSFFVAGSFNGWDFSFNPVWELKECFFENKKVFGLEKKIDEVNIPGNSGFPEFRFYSKKEKKSYVLEEKEVVDGFSFCGNKLIVKDENDCEIIRNLEKKTRIKTLKDFDLSLAEERLRISNVRLVPGTKTLYRGYHPFKKSRPELETENVRIKLVQEAFERFNINCDITLCGKERANVFLGEKKPKVIRLIEKNNNRLCVDIEYSLVYFHSDSEDFRKTLREIALFMIERKGPFYLHCRLGSDRTGVISSIFAALAGASWEEIVIDYEKTAEMGTGEVRSGKFLEYALTRMLKVSPSEKNLSEIMRNYFVDFGILSKAELNVFVGRLKGI